MLILILSIFIHSLYGSTTLYWQHTDVETNSTCTIAIPKKAIEFSKQYPIHITFDSPLTYSFDTSEYLQQTQLLLPRQFKSRWNTRDFNPSTFILILESDSPETTLIPLAPIHILLTNQKEVTFTPPPILIDLAIDPLSPKIMKTDPLFLSSDDQVLNTQLFSTPYNSTHRPKIKSFFLSRSALLQILILIICIFIIAIACIQYGEHLINWMKSRIKNNNLSFIQIQQQLLKNLDEYKAGEKTYKDLCSESLVNIKQLIAIAYQLPAEQMTVEELCSNPLGTSQQLSDQLKSILSHMNQIKFCEHAQVHPHSHQELDAFFKAFIRHLEQESYKL